MTSPNLLRMSANIRTEQEARASRPDPFLEQDVYKILARPPRGEHYWPELDWPTSTSRAKIMNEVIGYDEHTFACQVYSFRANGARQNVSEAIAREWLVQQHKEDRVFRSDFSDVPTFIYRHLTADEIRELSHVMEVA